MRRGQKRDSKVSVEDGGENEDTWNEMRLVTKRNMERNDAKGYGRVRKRGKINTGSRRME